MGKIIRKCWGWTDDKNTRFAILFLTAMLTLFGFKQVGMSGGGTLAVLTMGTTIHNCLAENELEHLEKPVTNILAQAWSNCGAVLLFTLLGASLDASKLNPQLVGTGVMLVVLGLVGRSIVLYLTLFLFPQWGWKEKIFSMVSWCPKATVQAALATAALDYLTVQIESGLIVKTDPTVVQNLKNAQVILTTAILSIIMTAPLFAVLMDKLAPHLLTDDREQECCKSVGEFGSCVDDGHSVSSSSTSVGDISSAGDGQDDDMC
jgi:NhaP-type Na+/H+ or K+/H+ antiporter